MISAPAGIDPSILVETVEKTGYTATVHNAGSTDVDGHLARIAEYRDAVRDPRSVTEELDISLIAPDGV